MKHDTETKPEPSWGDLILRYWPDAHWARDPDINAGELRAFFRHRVPDNAELCAVVRWLSGPDGKQEKRPSLREFMRAVCIYRKRQREDTEAPAADCGLCGRRGLLEYWPGVYGKQVILDAYSYAYSLSTPCGCPAGKRQIEHERKTGIQITDDGYAARFERARDQAGDRNRLAVARHAAGSFRVEELVQRTARVLDSDFAGMEAGR
jgi:hypothetical protein